MKYIYIILAALIISCSVITHIPEKSTFYGLDFTRFTSRGFLITPEKYLNAYESIGIVTYTYMPGANYMTTGKIEYESGGSRTKWMLTLD